jgi:acetolactate synthase-1/2/3 large subunit
MGYALPASIGACLATNTKRPVICITGDGGLQINIQEFQTIIHYALPVKIFILDNKCYGIIKQFQDTWLKSRYEASQLGYSTPDFLKVAKAYGFEAIQINNHSELEKKIKQVLAEKRPVFCDVLIDPDQKILPKVEFGMPLEDMTPFLGRQEFMHDMLIKPLEKSLDLKT